jgi:hypothetical protein
MLFLGVDWGEHHHDLCLLNQDGAVLAVRRILDGLTGVGELHALLASHAEDPAQVAVGIETDRGLLVGALLAAGYQVYAVNPQAVSRYLAHLQLRGPHDLRHSFSTWLEDEGIPARSIDELMGHQRSRGGELEGGSRIGARYRHTTSEMAARVIHALDGRLMLAVQVAEAITSERDRVF